MAQHPHPDKERRWLDLLRRWRQSRLGIREFCRRRRLSEPSFYAWRRMLRQRGLFDEDPSADAVPATTPPAFVKVFFPFFRERFAVRARLYRHEHGRSCLHFGFSSPPCPTSGAAASAG